MKKKPVLLLLSSGVVLHTIFFLAEGGAKVQQGSFLVNIYIYMYIYIYIVRPSLSTRTIGQLVGIGVSGSVGAQVADQANLCAKSSLAVGTGDGGSGR